MNEPTVSQKEVKTDVEGLEKKISLPVKPVEVVWVDDFIDNSKGTVPGPSDYRLTAVLKYDAQSSEELVKKLGDSNTEQSTGTTDIKEWFPAEVKSKSQNKDGKIYLEGTKFSAQLFFRQPYLNGNIIRVGKTDYFILNLFSF